MEAPSEVQPEAPSTEITGTEEQEPSVQVEAAPEESVAVAAPEEIVAETPTEVQPEAPQQVEYSSIEEVNLDSLSSDVRAHVEPIMKLFAHERASVNAEKEGYQRARQEFSELMEAMESSGYDVKPLHTRIEEQNQFITTMSNDIIDTAWQAFTTTHPEFASLPEPAREVFANELEVLFERHTGNTVLDRMNNAYDYALWRSGVDRNTLGKEKAVQSEPKKPIQTNPNARKQAAIADGRIATSAPVRVVDELSWDEVLNRHAHLLDG